MSKLILAAAAALALAGPAFAQTAAGRIAGQAQSNEATQSKFVSARGVDFNDHAQVSALYTRLWSTAHAVCDSGSAPRMAYADIGCARRALAEAVKTLDRPALTAMYENTYGDTVVYAASAR